MPSNFHSSATSI